ncbi:MAG: hypothetical protein HYX65_09205 [Gemmatimonadetes bacterium]|nr:hypothetical protein [Gemmatimonadota bacterium]
MRTFLVLVACAALHAASGARMARGQQVESPPAGPSLPNAPYVAPAVGTREVYTGFVNRIARNAGWRTEYTDNAGRPGARMGLFMADNPKMPVAMDTALFTRLWPLRRNGEVVIETQRYPRKWLWKIKVLGTERVKVPAGTFDCWVVETLEQPTVTTSKVAYSYVSVFYYAPSIASVVKFKQTVLSGTRRGQARRAELVRLERPGKEPVGGLQIPAMAGKKP